MSTFVIDNHPITGRAIASLLMRLRPTKSIVALDKLSKLQAEVIKTGTPEMLVVDLLLPGIVSMSAVKALKNTYPTTKLVIMSSMPANEVEKFCLEAGADIYIEKTSTIEHITELFESLLPKTEHDSNKGVWSNKITKRQKQIILLVDRGYDNRSIGEELGISDHTVKVHMWRIFRLLSIKSRTQLVHIARQNGFI